MPKSHLISRVLRNLVRLIFPIILIIFAVPIMGMAWNEVRITLGLSTVPVEVIGTGSMYPSLFWSSTEGGPEDEQDIVVQEYRTTPHLYRAFPGINLGGRSILRKVLGHGDLVAFKNDQTRTILASEQKNENSGFIKRVIGLPGDIIELRDGFVYRNSELLSEPYIASPRSTYGGTTILECQPVTVPAGEYLVLGDNRKVSTDSRFELGFVANDDIEYVLPYGEQSIYHPLYRDTAGDKDLLGQPSLSASEFLAQLNAKRQSLGIPPLKLQSSLARSSSLRGGKLLQDSDTSYTLNQSLRDSGYRNILVGEFVSWGHFSASELLKNLLYHKSTADQILNPTYQDIGISNLNQAVSGCPSQIIVGHLGGYVPASYDLEYLNSWQSLRTNLQAVIPSWEQAQGSDKIDQLKLQELLQILRRRLALTEEIIQMIETKNWPSDDQKERLAKDELDARLAQEIADLLNTP